MSRRSWETKGLAKDAREATGAGMKKYRNRPKGIPYPASAKPCPHCGKRYEPHLCPGPSTLSRQEAQR